MAHDWPDRRLSALNPNQTLARQTLTFSHARDGKTIVFACLFCLPRILAGQGPVFHTLYNFHGGADGAQPNGVIRGPNEVLYGTTYTGGANACGGSQCGTVFELVPAAGATWTKVVLLNFNGADGAFPSPSYVMQSSPGPSLVFGPKGAFYGVTMFGGSFDPSGGGNGGTVFELAPPSTPGGTWIETVLASFAGSRYAPMAPLGGLLISGSGELFGTTFSNDASTNLSTGGTVFTLLPPATPGGTWAQKVVYDFLTGSLGQSPQGGVISVDGSLYGTTFEGSGIGDCGTVYQLSPPAVYGGTWTGTVLHSFVYGTDDGCGATGALTVGPDGALYGTTMGGVSSTFYDCRLSPQGCGTVFQLIPPATPGSAWTETVIHAFTATGGDGAYPSTGVVLGKGGVLYGTTQSGGSVPTGGCPFFGAQDACGTVFELTPPTTPGGAWSETILHKNAEGSEPGPLTMSPDGVLYGTTWFGGASGNGTVFALKP
jgi:uncharacterized repeat protein (TIGR03803 family)